jgi:hypothetical protein
MATMLLLRDFHLHIDADFAPFLMDEVGEDGIFIAFLDIVGGPVVGQFGAGCLPVMRC